MMAAQTLTWFARHELRLAWRDWAAMMAGGRTTRERAITVIVLVFVVALHGFAYAILEPVLRDGAKASVQTYVVLTASLLTTFSMMLSQAIEHVTRAFYARADLDLILSSPAPARHLFAVRMTAITATSAVMSALLLSPFVNMAALIDGPRWLSAYAVIAAMSAFSTAMALALAMLMFKTLGPKRTRAIAQVVAAIVGAALLIAIQAIAVVTYGNLSRLSVLTSPELLAAAPGFNSLVWIPARAMLGEAGAGLSLLAAAAALLFLSIHRYADRFAGQAVAAAGTAEATEENARRARPYRAMTTLQALRAKEWALLKRDPWLISQTLMQVLYLIPPALMLWRDMGTSSNAPVILAPVLVMAFGQLAGGLAWLAISGEDAHDLVATAPVSLEAMTRAKVEAVIAVIALGASPFLLGLALLSAPGALAAALGIAAASTAAIVIQLWFKSAAKRSQFRRRQAASKGATFTEAFSSIFWAGAAGFAASSAPFSMLGAGAFALLALFVLWLTYVIRPRGQ